MNAGELASNAWVMAGEDSRYDGNDLTTPGGVALLALLNQAYFAVASHKFHRLGVIPFRGMERNGLYTARYREGVIESAGETVIIFGAADAAVVSVGDSVRVGSQVVEVVSVSTAPVVHTVAPAFSSIPDGGAAFSAGQRFLDLERDFGSSPRKVLGVQYLYDMTNREEVIQEANVDFFDWSALQLSVPEAYVRRGSTGLVLSSPVSAAFTYRAWWVELPAALVLASDEPVLPTHFSDAIIFRLAYLLRMKIQDYEAAAQMKLAYQDELKRLQNEYEPFWRPTRPGTVVVD